MNANESVFEVRAYDDERDRAALSTAQGLAFGIPLGDVPAWWDQAGRSNLRVVCRDGQVCGGLLILPFGQFIGGKRLEMAGIAGVAIAAEHRGQGAARALMQATLRELRTRGFVHSMLYASTYPLYRSVGYEVAGASSWITVPITHMSGLDRSLRLRPFAQGDGPAVRELYRKRARRSNGYLDRNEYIWNRTTQPVGKETRGYLVEAGGGLEGYIFAFEREVARDHRRLVITDFAAASQRAAERLLSFAADHSSLVRELICPVRVGDPLLFLMRETGYEYRTHDHWMVRLLDVRAALEDRGYARGLSGQLQLDVRDSLIADNEGRIILDVADGVGRVTPGGDGRLRIDAGALGSLWTGFATAEHLALVGHMRGIPEDLALATSLFGAPAPSCPDHF